MQTSATDTAGLVSLCRKLALLLRKRESRTLLKEAPTSSFDEESTVPEKVQPSAEKVQPPAGESNLEGLAMLTSVLVVLTFLASVAANDLAPVAWTPSWLSRVGSLLALVPLTVLLCTSPKGWSADIVALLLAGASLLHVISTTRTLIDHDSLLSGKASSWLEIYPAVVVAAFELLCASSCLAATVGGIRTAAPKASSEGLAMFSLAVVIGASLELATFALLEPTPLPGVVEIAVGGYGAGLVGCSLGLFGLLLLLSSQTINQPLLLIAAVLQVSSAVAILVLNGATPDLGKISSAGLLLVATGLELALASF